MTCSCYYNYFYYFYKNYYCTRYVHCYCYYYCFLLPCVVKDLAAFSRGLQEAQFYRDWALIRSFTLSILFDCNFYITCLHYLFALSLPCIQCIAFCLCFLLRMCFSCLEVLLLWVHPTKKSYHSSLETFFQYHLISSTST